MVRDVKDFGPKLSATTLTLPGSLSPGPPRPGYDVLPEPPSRRPCIQVLYSLNLSRALDSGGHPEIFKGGR